MKNADWAFGDASLASNWHRSKCICTTVYLMTRSADRSFQAAAVDELHGPEQAVPHSGRGISRWVGRHVQACPLQRGHRVLFPRCDQQLQQGFRVGCILLLLLLLSVHGDAGTWVVTALLLAGSIPRRQCGQR